MILWELASRKRPYECVEHSAIIRYAIRRGDREEIPEDLVRMY